MKISIKDLNKEQIEDLRKQLSELDKESSFEDCWNKVRPEWYLDNFGNAAQVNEPDFGETTTNHVPSERHVKQLQAIIKEMVVAEALNGRKVQIEFGYELFYDHDEEKVLNTNEEYSCSGVRYKDEETAQKAIEILTAIPDWTTDRFML